MFCVLLLFIAMDTISINRKPEIRTVTNTIIIPDSSYTVKRVVYDDLVNALIHTESRGKDTVVNQESGATGCLQLMPIMVREVNNILKRIGDTTRFKLIDRLDRNKSVAMFHIWRIYHHSGDSYEVISRCWNGGPNGYLIPQTIGYWNKVKRQIPGGKRKFD